MAPKKTGKAGSGKKVAKFTAVKRFSTVLSLIAFVVIISAGLMNEVSFITITYRAFFVMLAISFGTRFVLRALISYEEARRG